MKDEEPGKRTSKRSTTFFMMSFVCACLWGFEYLTGCTIPTRRHPEIREATSSDLWIGGVLAGSFLAAGFFAKAFEEDE